MSYYIAPVSVISGPTILTFTANQEPSPAVPFELQRFYTQDTWGPRISAITKKASRYYKPGFEWTWLIVSFVLLLGAPIAVYFIALDNLPGSDDIEIDRDGFVHNDGFDRYWKARLISFATWVALMLIVFVPMHVWKNSGKKAVNQMLQNYEAQDRAARPGAAVPSLRMKMPGVVTKTIKLVVYIPPGPSYYQSGANVPPFIANPPQDPARNYYQPPPQQVPVQGGPWAPGGPMNRSEYNPQDERVPGYEGAGAYSDEKNPFEDVKV